MESNPNIDNFIQNALFIDEEKGEQLILLRKIILEIKPDAKEEIKYGGLVFMVDAKLICGIFIRKEHISVEFSFGAMMLDSDNFLEGTGKQRRHLKIFQQKDIENKKVEYYVRQSFKL
ncbi:MAG: DUF1801 domain-containing protein [Candidatus Aenigmarchaeota archaeon]|nr:DUF1801 domain-containing protein [Candidatus Aenigmarchaeota archaeon]